MIAIEWGSYGQAWKTAVSIWDLVTYLPQNDPKAHAVMRSLSVNFTGLFTKSSVLVGKETTVSGTQSGDTCPFLWQAVNVFSSVKVLILRVLGVL